MFLRKRINDRRTLMPIGMLCLLLANIWHRSTHPSTLLGQDLADGIFGLFMGACIALNLLSLRSRGCSGDGG
jgi:hypothetical protein